MTAIDIPKSLRAEDKFHHIDMGFLNRRLCITAITAFNPEALQYFRQRQKPGNDPQRSPHFPHRHSWAAVAFKPADPHPRGRLSPRRALVS